MLERAMDLCQNVKTRTIMRLVDLPCGMQAIASNAALYIMSHDVDMQNPVCWLEKGVAGYSLPDMEHQVNPIRLCVQPCQLQFRSQAAHARSEKDSATRTRNSPVQYLHMKVHAAAAA
jgi:hypothetical protein